MFAPTNSDDSDAQSTWSDDMPSRGPVRVRSHADGRTAGRGAGTDGWRAGRKGLGDGWLRGSDRRKAAWMSRVFRVASTSAPGPPSLFRPSACAHRHLAAEKERSALSALARTSRRLSLDKPESLGSFDSRLPMTGHNSLIQTMDPWTPEPCSLNPGFSVSQPDTPALDPQTPKPYMQKPITPRPKTVDAKTPGAVDP